MSLKDKFLIVLSSQFLANANGLYDLPLEKLLNIDVSVASKQKLSKADAPGVITVYTQKDIEELGYYSIKDLASITPGFSSASIFAGQSNLMVRGQRVEGFDNNKVLVLLDGLPIAHLRNGRAPIDEDMSLIGVEKVEFLKGPGAALYGTGAFFGVINIVTVQASEGEQESRTMFYTGNDDARGVRGYTVFNKGIYQGKLRVSQYSQEPTGEVYGYKTNSRAYEHAKTRTNQGFDSKNDLHIDASIKISEGFLKNFTFGYISNRNEHGTFESLNDYNAYTYEFVTNSLYASYRKDISENLEFTAYGRKTESIEEGNRYSYNFVFHGHDGQVEAKYSLNKKAKFILGTSFDYRFLGDKDNGTRQGDGTGANAFVENGSGPLRTYSVYAQYANEFDFMKGLLMTLGFRLDEVSSDYAKASQVSPRLSLVQKISDKVNFKFLFASALRSPDLKSTLINAGVLEEGGTLKQDKLDAETSKSYELGITYNNKKVSTAFSIFHIVTKDAINRRSFNGKDSYRNDSGDTSSYGVEFESKYLANESFYTFFNGSYAKARLDNVEGESSISGQEVEGLPRLGLNLGAHLKYHKFNTTLVGKFIDEFRTSDQSQRHNGSFLLDLNSRYNYNSSLAFSLTVANLIGRDARVPDFQEQYYPRSVRVGAEFKF